MSRKQNKRARPEVAAESILRKIHEAVDVTDDDHNQLFNISKPVCEGCRVNTRDNPNCFCGLVPVGDGSRKTGLWQKDTEIIYSFGLDPNSHRRNPDSTPGGLANLGATCYANSVIQFLYMNTAFREGVFSVEVDVLTKNPVLNEICRLFAQLCASESSVVDSDAFVKTLELDNDIQQDLSEFLTLLLSLVERCLRQSKVPKAKTIVEDLFRGTVSNVTTCSKCGLESEASSKVDDFYALDLNVNGFKSLDASLNDYFSLEQLNGDNQYVCGSCNAKVDATRCIKLRSLPPVITFPLRRCIFLPKTTTKKKITSSFSFPQVLDMGSRLAESSQKELTYDLSAVLIHEGNSVDRGHYVAHIKDEKTHSWWKFDDDRVSDLGKRPFKEGSENTSPATKSEVFSSRDAYVLIYSRRCGKQEKQQGHVNKITKGEVPLHLHQWINGMNKSFVESCDQYDSISAKALIPLTERMEERKKEVKRILAEAAVQSLEEHYFWISADWLRQWADTINPPALDNTPLLCSHGKVDASKVNCMKRISAVAWDELESKYKGGPKLGKEDYCRDCLMDAARMVVYRDRRTLMKSIASDVISGTCEDGMYYISRPWLQQWMKRKNPGEADAGPTNAITCNHGGLMPEQAPGAKRITIPENLWSFLVEDALKVNSSQSSCPCFPSNSIQCSHCQEELSEVADLEDSRRKQRQSHEKLASGKGITLTPQSRYFLMPSAWLVQWRSYIKMTGKNSSWPEFLDGVVSTLKCKKHTRLVERLPELDRRRGSFFQKNPSTDKLTIIPEHDWKQFCEDWGGISENGVSALIDAQHLILTTSLEVCEECIGERESTELTQNREKEAPEAIIEASDSNFDEVDRRTSKRSRRTNSDELCNKKTGVQDIEQGFRGTLLTADISPKACDMFRNVYVRKIRRRNNEKA